MLGVILLCFIYCYAECHNAECRYAECHYAEYRCVEIEIIFKYFNQKIRYILSPV